MRAKLVLLRPPPTLVYLSVKTALFKDEERLVLGAALGTCAKKLRTDDFDFRTQLNPNKLSMWVLAWRKEASVNQCSFPHMFGHSTRA